jgi:ribosomal protein S18 acetylase RimI-like enzyme
MYNSTMHNFVVRRARESDLPALGRLGVLLAETHLAFDRQRFELAAAASEEGYAAFLRLQMKEEDVGIFVAERDGAVVGYVYAELEPLSWKELREAAGFIHDLAVDPQHQGGGAGAALMEKAAEWLRDRGAPRIILCTAERNVVAQRLFSRLGFRRTMVEMTREIGGDR